jgi:hypothetical protein
LVAHHVHTHSLRLASGEEVLVSRVTTRDGKVGFGYSLALDATASRHMAERNAGVREGARAELPEEIRALAAQLSWAT